MCKRIFRKDRSEPVFDLLRRLIAGVDELAHEDLLREIEQAALSR